MERPTKTELSYVPGPDFVEDNKESLIDIEMNENTELWLIQLPNDQFPDFDGQKISLELDGDGPLGTIETKTGKQYKLVNYPSEAADISVFLSSPSGPKIAGKISRHVLPVHYPEPKELIALELDAKKPMPSSSKTSLTSSYHPSMSSKSQRMTRSQSRSQSNHNSKRSSASEVTDGSQHSKRTNAKSSRYSNQSAQDSGRGRSEVTFSGSSDLSHQKKRRKTDTKA